jgi:uncharacterized damage-inducible protein DinB
MTMLPDATIREWQIDQLRKDLHIVRGILANVTPEQATGLRDGGDGWTVTEVLCHLRDFDSIFLERAQITAERRGIMMPFTDANAMALERQYNAQPLQTVYEAWVGHRAAYLGYLEGLEEGAWSRTGLHPRRGPMTLAQQLAQIAWHDINHIEQIVKILGEKRTGSAG